MNKYYIEMSHDEQVELIEKMADYQNNDIPKLQACGRFFDEENKQRYFRGIELLTHFQQCNPFTTTASRITSNFDQFAYTMIVQIKLIANQLASTVQMQMNDGSKVIVLQQPQSLRRGRPTEEESRQREKEKQQQEKAKAVAHLTGAKIAVSEAAPIAERESDTSRRKAEEADLFSAAININDNENDNDNDNDNESAERTKASHDNDNDNDNNKTTKQQNNKRTPNSSLLTPNSKKTPNSSLLTPNSFDELKSLREWRWLMPEALSLKVANVKDMRNEIAVCSERGKQLLLEGADENEIKQYTQKAKELNRELSEIYFAVDWLLAVYYVMLTKVNKDYGKFAEKYAKKGGYNVLVNDMKPYYDKLTAESADGNSIVKAEDVLAEANKLEADRIKAETKDPERDKEIHAIKAYFSRKDVKASKARLAKMKQYYDRAVELELDEDTLAGFQVIIDYNSSLLTPNS